MVSADRTGATIDVDDLSVDVRGGPSILAGVSFGVPAGTITTIVGESGSGKSTVLRSLIGLLPAGLEARGTIRIDGTDVLGSGKAMRSIRGSRVGLVLQDALAALNPLRRVGPQVAGVLRHAKGHSRKSAYTRSLELLVEVGLSDVEDRWRQYPSQLSGGMRQRAAIAAAIALEPDVLLADEPTSALDVTVQAEVVTMLERLVRSHGMSLVLVTHDLGLATIADRVVVMLGGTVVEEGPADLLSDGSATHPYTNSLLANRPSLVRREGPDRAGGRNHRLGGRTDVPQDVKNLCPYVGRCPVEAAVCRAEPPPEVSIGHSHVARCHAATTTTGVEETVR